jgi:hypothetical protein
MVVTDRHLLSIVLNIITHNKMEYLRVKYYNNKFTINGKRMNSLKISHFYHKQNYVLNYSSFLDVKPILVLFLFSICSSSSSISCEETTIANVMRLLWIVHTGICTVLSVTV